LEGVAKGRRVSGCGDGKGRELKEEEERRWGPNGSLATRSVATPKMKKVIKTYIR
jgi:hypothetical protein